MYNNLIAYGYFPKELPDGFSTGSLLKVLNKDRANLIRASHRAERKLRSDYKICHYNLARPYSIRRRLGIVNPIPFAALCATLDDNKADIFSQISSYDGNGGKISESADRIRAVVRSSKTESDIISKLEFRSEGKCLLQCDISRFYGSIYTHSIPWAMNGKIQSKRSRNPFANVGNEIDYWIRSGQDGQTIGIPIGPDTSHIISEIVLSYFDKKINESSYKMYRFVDDIEISTRTGAEAEEAMHYVQTVLADLELELNRHKTKILQAPQSIGEMWASELRMFNFRDNNSNNQMYDIVEFVNKAIRLFAGKDAEYAIKYSISRLSNVNIKIDNWRLYLNILISSMNMDPTCIENSSLEILKYTRMTYPLDKERMSKLYSDLMVSNLTSGNHSAVAWIVCFCMQLNLTIKNYACDAMLECSDSVLYILMIDAMEKGLTETTLEYDCIQNIITSSGLAGSEWLLAYQYSYFADANYDLVNKLLDTSEIFREMFENRVSFYQSNNYISTNRENKYIENYS